MRLRLQELQDKDNQTQKARAEYLKSWDDIKKVLHYQGFFHVSEIIWTKFINRHYNNLLVSISIIF